MGRVTTIPGPKGWPLHLVDGVLKSDPLYVAFRSARRHAGCRGIGWELTFSEWISVWRESGKLDQRGSRRGHYVMSRHRDIGPYAVGNISIQLCEDNARDARKWAPSQNLTRWIAAQRPA